MNKRKVMVLFWGSGNPVFFTNQEGSFRLAALAQWANGRQIHPSTNTSVTSFFSKTCYPLHAPIMVLQLSLPKPMIFDIGIMLLSRSDKTLSYIAFTQPLSTSTKSRTESMTCIQFFSRYLTTAARIWFTDVSVLSSIISEKGCFLAMSLIFRDGRCHAWLGKTAFVRFSYVTVHKCFFFCKLALTVLSDKTACCALPWN